MDELELAERFEDILQIALSDAEMDIPYVEPMEWDLVGVAAGSLRVASLTILLGLGELGDDRNA